MNLTIFFFSNLMACQERWSVTERKDNETVRWAAPPPLSYNQSSWDPKTIFIHHLYSTLPSFAAHVPQALPALVPRSLVLVLVPDIKV